MSEPDFALRNHNDRCFTLEFSPDGEYLAAACSNDSGRFPINVYEVASGKLMFSLEGTFIQLIYAY